MGIGGWGMDFGESNRSGVIMSRIPTIKGTTSIKYFMYHSTRSLAISCMTCFVMCICFPSAHLR